MSEFFRAEAQKNPSHPVTASPQGEARDCQLAKGGRARPPFRIPPGSGSRRVQCLEPIETTPAASRVENAGRAPRFAEGGSDSLGFFLAAALHDPRTTTSILLIAARAARSPTTTPNHSGARPVS